MRPDQEKAIRAAAEAEYKAAECVRALEARNRPGSEEERVKAAQDLAVAKALYAEAVALRINASAPRVS